MQTKNKSTIEIIIEEFIKNIEAKPIFDKDAMKRIKILADEKKLTKPEEISRAIEPKY